MVLGAGGRLGDLLVDRLVAASRKVICVDLQLGSNVRSYPGVEVIETDVRDTARFAPRLAECVVVFNCAGVQHPTSTREIYEVNRNTPAEIYTMCKENGVETFVHISSMNAHGENPSSTEPLDETTSTGPITHYGRSKAEGDARLKALVAAGETRLIILRPGVIYGDRPSGNMREFMGFLRKFPMPLFSDRGTRRTYVDAAKVVDAMLLAEHAGRSGEIYLIGDEDPLCTLRLYQIIAEELGTRLNTIRLPLFAARACEWLAIQADHLGRHVRILTIVGEFGRHTFCISTKAERELGFVPHKSSEAGLRRMVRLAQKG
jgi:nucleoside-diphosphate-sugar epimerase